MKRVFLLDNDDTTNDPVQREAADAVRRLDELRSEFLVDLSHELRTPVTALKLAMEGLFSQLRGALNPSQRNLARISRRNLERLVTLVENQLELLRMILGEVSACPRLVDIDSLLRSLPRTPSVWSSADADGDAQGGEAVSYWPVAHGGQLFVFTDPDYLAAIVECALGAGQQYSRRSIHLGYDEEKQSCEVDVRVDYPDAAEGDSPAGDAAGLTSKPDFEYRAYRALLEKLGGDVLVEKDNVHKRVRISLPCHEE